MKVDPKTKEKENQRKTLPKTSNTKNPKSTCDLKKLKTLKK